MKTKRIVSALLAAAMLVLLAVPAFAEDDVPADAAALQQTEATTETPQPEETPAAEPTTSPEAEPQQTQPEPAAEAEQQEAPAADAPAEDTQLTYVALGDSITAGVGLKGLHYNTAAIGLDLAPNFEDYSPQCYVAKVAKGLKLDSQHAINLGLPGLMTKDMVDMVRDGAMPQMNQASGSYYVYPQYQEYIRKADIISIQIGSNDALVPCIVALGEATNWKSEQFANTMVSGQLRNLSIESLRLLFDGLSKLKLTKEESAATRQLLNHGMGTICNEAYTNVSTYLPQVIAEIRALNPDAEILLLGYTNPVPLLSSWSSYFSKLNSFAKDLAAQQDKVTYVSIPFTQTATDGHPTISGQRYIGRHLLSAIKKINKAKNK